MKLRFRFLKITMATLLLAASGLHAQLSEDFDDVASLPGQGWVFLNRSTNPSSWSWYQGVNGPYIGSFYGSIESGVGTLSNWLLTPTLKLQNGDVMTFFTGSGSTIYPDRLELRLSTSGASTNVGETEMSVGDFSTLLLTINPTLEAGGYPTTWTQYTVTLSGLAGPVTGRFGFRHFVTDSGPDGFNGYVVGIDELRATSTVVPEPSTYAVGMAVLLGGVALLRRRASARTE